MRITRVCCAMFCVLAAIGFMSCAQADFSSNGPSDDGKLKLEEFQGLETTGASFLKHFTIGTDHFIAVANYYNGSSYVLDSKIYKWNGNTFCLYQLIPGTQHAFDFEFFTIEGNNYLIVANYYNGTTCILSSPIYKWNPSTKFFESYVNQTAIATYGASDFDFFTMGDNYYLAVANKETDTSYNTNSYVYQWNNTRFDTTNPVATIATSGANDWEHFTIGDNNYLVVANYYSNTGGYNIPSRIYKWNITSKTFVQIQELATNGAFDCEYFAIGNDHYLAIANYYDGTTYNINSRIYKWNPETEQFGTPQAIPTKYATGWKHFTVNGQHYLAVSNFYDSEANPKTYQTNSYIYRWNGSKFAEDDALAVPTKGARDWEFFTIGSMNFLAVANCQDDADNYNQLSYIYRVSN
jgi:hypothetical protein